MEAVADARWLGGDSSHKGHSSSTPDTHLRQPGTTDVLATSANSPITTCYPDARIEAYRLFEPFEETNTNTIYHTYAPVTVRKRDSVTVFPLCRHRVMRLPRGFHSHIQFRSLSVKVAWVSLIPSRWYPRLLILLLLLLRLVRLICLIGCWLTSLLDAGASGDARRRGSRLWRWRRLLCWNSLAIGLSGVHARWRLEALCSLSAREPISIRSGLRWRSMLCL